MEKELNILRAHHLDKRILFVGGDGLTVMRLNHLIKDKPHLYQDSAPLIIPVQGESPHGMHHILHAGWRLYVKLIRVCADELGNRQVVDDPSVQHYNNSLHFLWRMTRAISEYLVHLSRSDGAVDLDLTKEFVEACEFNIDLAYLVHFLYDFAFLVLDFKQQVRAGASTDLDLLWREFFALGRTSSANKTQYVPMAIMRIFWADAMHPELALLYRNMRSIPMSAQPGRMIGWDCVIEWLNGAISSGVANHVTEEKIEQFIQNFPMLEHNYHLLQESTMSGAEEIRRWMKDMDSDVAKLKSFFFKNIGADWQTATRVNVQSQLGLHRVGNNEPWEEVDAVMRQSGDASVPAFVASHVRALTSTFYAFTC